MINLDAIGTEARNPNSLNIDTVSTLEMVSIINNEDKKVAAAVETQLPQIARMVEAAADAFAKGGRLVYMGAGTSGRLGVLDASECPPTYGVEPDLVVGLIAGGDFALRNAVENAEDSEELGAGDLKKINLSAKDFVIGLAASGRTPYVIGGLRYAKSVGAATGAIACAPHAKIAAYADMAALPDTGPEVVTGSTRMKSGTAQKMVLNMVSTGAMIKTGKVFSNLMVDVKPSNLKLIERQKRIVMAAAETGREEAERALAQAGGNCKLAIFMLLSGLEAASAEERLRREKGFIRQALASLK